MGTRLASGTATAQLLRVRGRTIVNAKDHHLVVDSPIYLGGPNEEINPIDLLFSSLASHGLFVCEKIAQSKRIPLDDLQITVTGDFDPRGALGEPVDPGLRSMKVLLMMAGPGESQARDLVEAFKTYCTIYTTLARAVRITVELVLEKPKADPIIAGK